MPFGLLTRFDPGKHVLRGGPDPSYKRDDFAVFLPSKCIRLCKQQRSQQHGAAKMSTGAARHGRKCGFGTDSSAAVWPFVEILWPLVKRTVSVRCFTVGVYDRVATQVRMREMCEV